MAQSELAARARVNVTTISAIELGKQDPRMSTVRRLAAALGVDPDELIVVPGDYNEDETQQNPG